MIMDPRLQNQYSLPAARRIAKLADSCLNKNPKDRPSMSQVVEILKQALEESQRSSSDPRNSPSSLATLSALNKPFRRSEDGSTSRQVPPMAKVCHSSFS